MSYENERAEIGGISCLKNNLRQSLQEGIAGYLDILTVKRSCLSWISDGLVSEDVVLLVDEALVTEPVGR
jgi:hypothetical protein